MRLRRQKSIITMLPNFFFLPFAQKSQNFKWPHVPQMVEYKYTAVSFLHVYSHTDHTWTNKLNASEILLKIDYCSLYSSSRSPYVSILPGPLMSPFTWSNSAAKDLNFDLFFIIVKQKKKTTKELSDLFFFQKSVCVVKELRIEYFLASNSL